MSKPFSVYSYACCFDVVSSFIIFPRYFYPLLPPPFLSFKITEYFKTTAFPSTSSWPLRKNVHLLALINYLDKQIRWEANVRLLPEYWKTKRCPTFHLFYFFMRKHEIFRHKGAITWLLKSSMKIHVLTNLRENSSFAKALWTQIWVNSEVLYGRRSEVNLKVDSGEDKQNSYLEMVLSVTSLNSVNTRLAKDGYLNKLISCILAESTLAE